MYCFTFQNKYLDYYPFIGDISVSLTDIGAFVNTLFKYNKKFSALHLLLCFERVYGKILVYTKGIVLLL